MSFVRKACLACGAEGPAGIVERGTSATPPSDAATRTSYFVESQVSSCQIVKNSDIYFNYCFTNECSIRKTSLYSNCQLLKETIKMIDYTIYLKPIL